ncbi:membrane hypothetical protein [[Clostridium] ultunense Esp]|nr:membrane hypothetical protein [[Clostridium] ultunense Esp]
MALRQACMVDLVLCFVARLDHSAVLYSVYARRPFLSFLFFASDGHGGGGFHNLVQRRLATARVDVGTSFVRIDTVGGAQKRMGAGQERFPAHGQDVCRKLDFPFTGRRMALVGYRILANIAHIVGGIAHPGRMGKRDGDRHVACTCRDHSGGPVAVSAMVACVLGDTDPRFGRDACGPGECGRNIVGQIFAADGWRFYPNAVVVFGHCVGVCRNGDSPRSTGLQTAARRVYDGANGHDVYSMCLGSHVLAVLHLIFHGLFKAALFLRSGSVVPRSKPALLSLYPPSKMWLLNGMLGGVVLGVGFWLAAPHEPLRMLRALMLGWSLAFAWWQLTVFHSGRWVGFFILSGFGLSAMAFHDALAAFLGGTLPAVGSATGTEAGIVLLFALGGVAGIGFTARCSKGFWAKLYMWLVHLGEARDWAVESHPRYLGTYMRGEGK